MKDVGSTRTAARNVRLGALIRHTRGRLVLAGGAQTRVPIVKGGPSRRYLGGSVAADSQKDASASMSAQKRSKSPALTT